VPKRIEEARRNFTKFGKYNSIRLLEGDADEMLKHLRSKKETVDLIFLDAAKGQYMSFLREIEGLLETRAMLLADNVLREGDILESRYAVTRRDRTIHGRMREFLYALTKSEEWETLVLPVGDGITISQWRGRV
jgi:predicted O-methyltransferase YrrM